MVGSKFHKNPLTSILLLFLGVYFLCASNPVYAAPTITDLVMGVGMGVGIDADFLAGKLYYVESTSGELSCLDLSTNSTSTVATGLSVPEGLALAPGGSAAYVTQGTGQLVLVDLGTNTKTTLFAGLSSPHQLALDLGHNWVYVVERGSGELSRIELVGYTKSSITGVLDHPVGLAITSDGNYAYVTEGGTENRVSQVDLSTGVRTDVVTGLDDPFYLTWNNESQTALYLIERGAVNRLSRIDLTVSPATTSVIADGLSSPPAAVTVDPAQTLFYVTTDTTVTKIDIFADFLALAGPWLQGVGHIPSTRIIDGYANTPAEYSFGHFVDSPFGKVLKVWGNFDALVNAPYNARYYRVLISKGSASSYFKQAWNIYIWNGVEYELLSISPDSQGFYPIPGTSTTDLNLIFPAHRNLLMRWETRSGNLVDGIGGEYNGKYTLELEAYDSGKNPLSLTGTTTMDLMIDNTHPIVEIEEIRHDGVSVARCAIVDTPPNDFTFRIVARDPKGHMLNYHLYAFWGNNEADLVSSDSFTSTGPGTSTGVNSVVVPPPGPSPWQATETQCAHTFRLAAWKRTIDGYDYIYWKPYRKSITIYLP